MFAELIIGYALPGRPIAMMMFKTYGYTTMTQALQFTSDFKLGHYMKVPYVPVIYILRCPSLAHPRLMLVQPTRHVLFTSRRRHHCWYCPARRPDLDVRPHPAHVRARAEGSLHLPLNRSFRDRVGHLGRHRAAAAVLQRPDLLRARVLLPRRRHLPARSVPHLAAVAELLPALRQLPRHLQRHAVDPPRVGGQLRPVDDRRLHLQLRHPTATLLLVDEVQL